MKIRLTVSFAACLLASLNVSAQKAYRITEWRSYRDCMCIGI